MKWCSLPLTKSSVVSHFIHSETHAIFCKGNQLELVSLDDSGILISIHKQCIFTKIRSFVKYDGPIDENHQMEPEEKLIGLLLHAEGQLALIRYSTNLKRFIVIDSMFNWKHRIPFYHSCHLDCSQNGFIACGNRRNSLAISFISNKNDTKELKFDINNRNIQVINEKNERDANIWSICFIKSNVIHSKCTLACLITRGNSSSIILYQLEYNDKNKDYLIGTKEIALSNINYPYRIESCSNSYYPNGILILLTKGNIYIINDLFEQNHSISKLPLLNNEVLIEGITLYPFSNSNNLLINSDNGQLYNLSLHESFSLEVIGDIGSSGKIGNFNNSYVLLCGDMNDSKMLYFHGNMMDCDLTEENQLFEVIYEIPNWSPILDFCVDENPNQQDKLYACGGTADFTEIVCFQHGITLEDVLSTDISGYGGSINDIWSITKDSYILIILSFINSTRILMISEDEQMEDISKESGFDVENSTILASGDLSDDTIIQITSKNVHLCFPKSQKERITWTCNELDKNIINCASIRGNDILLGISSGSNSWLYYLQVIHSKNQYQIVEIKHVVFEDEISSVLLPPLKYCNLTTDTSEQNDILSLSEIALIGTHKPSIDILSMVQPLKSLTRISLDNLTSTESLLRIHSLSVITIANYFLVLVGLRDGIVLSYRLIYSPIIEDENNESQESDKEMIDIDSNRISHNFSLVYLSTYQVGIHPVSLTPIRIENRNSCIILSDKLWLLKEENESVNDKSIKLTSIGMENISCLSSYVSMQSEELAIFIMNNYLHISQINSANAFSYNQIIRETISSFPEFKRPFKKIIFSKSTSFLIVLSDNIMVAYDTNGNRISQHVIADKAFSICEWTTNNSSFIVLNTMKSIEFFELKSTDAKSVQGTNNYKFTRIHSLSTPTIITVCPFNKEYLIFGGMKQLGIIEAKQDTISICWKENIQDIIRSISCNSENNIVSIGCGVTGVHIYVFDIDKKIMIRKSKEIAKMIHANQIVSNNEIMASTSLGSIYTLLHDNEITTCNSSFYIGETILQLSKAKMTYNFEECEFNSIIIATTIMGSIFGMIPVSERDYNILEMIQNEMLKHPESSLLLGNEHHLYRSEEMKVLNVIDGELLQIYFTLSSQSKNDICNAIQMDIQSTSKLIRKITSKLQ